MIYNTQATHNKIHVSVHPTSDIEGSLCPLSDVDRVQLMLQHESRKLANHNHSEYVQG